MTEKSYVKLKDQADFDSAIKILSDNNIAYETGEDFTIFAPDIKGIIELLKGMEIYFKEDVNESDNTQVWAWDAFGEQWNQVDLNITPDAKADDINKSYKDSIGFEDDMDVKSDQKIGNIRVIELRSNRNELALLVLSDKTLTKSEILKVIKSKFPEAITESLPTFEQFLNKKD